MVQVGKVPRVLVEVVVALLDIMLLGVMVAQVALLPEQPEQREVLMEVKVAQVAQLVVMDKQHLHQ